MRIRILTLFFITSTLAGCGATRTINDTEYGVWNYYENDDSDGYTDLELEYVARNGKKLNNLFATTGFYHGIAIVASCSLIQNDKNCASLKYYLINPDAEIIADLSEYDLPMLSLCQPIPDDEDFSAYPSLIYLTDIGETQAYNFPLVKNFYDYDIIGGGYKYKAKTCAEATLSGNHLAFYENRILVYDRKANRYGFIDFNGQLIIPATYKLASTFYPSGYAYGINDENIPGLIYADGRFEPFIYPCKSKISEDLYQVSKDGKLYHYSKDAPFRYGVSYYINELVNTSKLNCSDSKVGIVDKDNNIVIPIIYDTVKVSLKVPYIIATNTDSVDATVLYTKDGKELYKASAEHSIIPGDHFVLLKNDRGKWAVGDTKGNLYTQHIYDGLGYYYYTEDIGEYVTSKYIGIKEKGKSGIIDSYGQIVVMPKYDDIIFKSRNLIITKLNNKYGVFYDGVQIYETKYTNISEFKDNKAVAKIGEEEHFLFLDKEKELEFNRLKHIPPHRRVKKDENSNER